MSQNPSESKVVKKPADKTQDVNAPVVRVGDALVRKGETVTGNPARTKYLGGHLGKAKRPAAPTEPVKEASKSKGGTA